MTILATATFTGSTVDATGHYDTTTTAPIYALKISMDGTNWITTSCAFSPTAAGCFGRR